jgi:hypothetical protein
MTNETNFDTLMHVICVRWGFCGSVQEGKFMHVTDCIPESGIVTANQFAEWVLRADSDTTASAPFKTRWQKRVRSAFIEHMGADRVDARRLRCSEET